MTIFNEIQQPFYFNYCYQLTRCTDAAYDLMMETALTIYDRKYQLDNTKALFTKIAKNNFLNQTKTVELKDNLPYETDEYHDTPDFATIEKILNKPYKSKREFVTKEIFKLYLELGTEQAVSDHTRIKRSTIHSQIKKFKKYVRDNM